MQKLIILLVRFYQKTTSCYLKSQCKFYPSCSEYAILALKQYGIIKGIAKSLFRLIRCHPFAKNKIDFP
ncbi:MAG: membrane protein insertion efficiency factor YidD [Holosporaceae bacterium]|nr:membrane protein insertion efficiency factor YidD [Holosporaceae bacterium]